jgi:hypothetical protein
MLIIPEFVDFGESILENIIFIVAEYGQATSPPSALAVTNI